MKSALKFAESTGPQSSMCGSLRRVMSPQKESTEMTGKESAVKGTNFYVYILNKEYKAIILFFKSGWLSKPCVSPTQNSKDTPRPDSKLFRS